MNMRTEQSYFDMRLEISTVVRIHYPTFCSSDRAEMTQITVVLEELCVSFFSVFSYIKFFCVSRFLLPVLCVWWFI